MKTDDDLTNAYMAGHAKGVEAGRKQAQACIKCGAPLGTLHMAAGNLKCGWPGRVTVVDCTKQAQDSKVDALVKRNIGFLYEELRKATDGGSESMTHDDALKQIAYWQDKDEQAQAVEPATGERSELVKELRLLKFHVGGSIGDIVKRAADMLKADGEAQQVAVPLTEAEKSAAWVAATIEMPSHENCYLRGMLDAEAHHGITQGAKPVAQQVAVPAWVPMSEKLLNSKESWLYQQIWIAGSFGVEQATYEWRQGRYPHCFDTPDGDSRGLSEITHAMPVEIPASPQGAKP